MNLRCVDNKNCGWMGLFTKGKVYRARPDGDKDGGYLVKGDKDQGEFFVQLDDNKLNGWGKWRRTKAMTDEQKREKALLKAVNKEKK